jgi:hypothetical protein
MAGAKRVHTMNAVLGRTIMSARRFIVSAALATIEQ